MGSGQDYIGPYRILKLVRAGKATQIWEAMNPTDNKRVALKSLHGSYIDDKQEINHLRHEYTVGKDFNHPSVNRVYEFNIARGIPYVVMDFFNAPNLKQSLRQFPDRVQQHHRELLQQSVDGLGHMHEFGWVHRDVKPDNFLLSAEGELKLIDFAIASKAKKKGGFKFLAKKVPVQGTRSYMSPEQIRGEQVDGRADVYSLGCVFYEIFAGRPPFTANSADELLTKHLRSPVPTLAAANEHVTSDFAKLVARMMSKKPDGRPASMGHLSSDLAETRLFKTRRQST